MYDTVSSEIRADTYWQDNEANAMGWFMTRKAMRRSVSTMRSYFFLARRMMKNAKKRGADLTPYHEAVCNRLAEYRAAKRVLLNREWA